MTPSAIQSWTRLVWDWWRLSLEAATVIGLRSLRLAEGGTVAAREGRRMVEEKIEAAAALQARALTGALGLSPRAVTAKSLSHYRRKVRANRRRLGRSSRR